MILTLGAFDGFHRGHQKLLEKAASLAGDEAMWAVVTFSPHPQMVLSPSPRPALFSESERDLIARFLRIPNLIKIDFTRWLAELAPEAFMDFLAKNIDVTGIVVGDDFRYGQSRKGDVAQLAESCRRRRWHVAVLPQLVLDGQSVSSTLLRRKIAGGDVVAASELLGYPFFAVGVVVPGDRRGRTLGFPTANLSLPQGKIFPERGVYATAALVGEEWRPGALNVGFNPTFEGRRSLRFEVHFPGFDGDLYGQSLPVFVLKRLREEMRFGCPEELAAQMGRDVGKVLEVWERYRPTALEPLQRWKNLLLMYV